MEYSFLSDSLLVKLLRTGDKGAFKEIYRKYWHSLFVVAQRKLHSQAAAEELIQDLFVDLWERREALQIEELQKYLFSAVKYKVLNHIKSLVIRQQYEKHSSARQSDADCHTEHMLAFDELTQAIEQGIAHLPQKTQQIFRLNRLEKQSVRQIALQLYIPERTVEYHITQALRTLRFHLKEFV